MVSLQKLTELSLSCHFRFNLNTSPHRPSWPAPPWTLWWWSRPTWSWVWSTPTPCSRCWSAPCAWITSRRPSSNVSRVTWSAQTASPASPTVPPAGRPCRRRGTWAWSRWRGSSSSPAATIPWDAQSPTHWRRRRSTRGTAPTSSSSVPFTASVPSEARCPLWSPTSRPSTRSPRCQSSPRGLCSTEQNTSLRETCGTLSLSGMTTYSGLW